MIVLGVAAIVYVGYRIATQKSGTPTPFQNPNFQDPRLMTVHLPAPLYPPIEPVYYAPPIWK